MSPRRVAMITDAPLAQLVLAQGGRCFYCGEPFSKARKPTRDHLFPRSMGCDLRGNKIAAHAKCNSQKGCRMPTGEEYMRAALIYEAIGLRLAYRLEPVGTQTIYAMVPNKDGAP